MSLVQRVTGIDGYDRISSKGSAIHPGIDTTRSLRRVISYDAIPEPRENSQATAPQGGVTAYKVSAAWRIAQVVVQVVSCWLASGIVFGFAALKPVLVDQGVYRDRCSNEELDLGVEICYGQDLKLNLFFAIASTTCNLSALPVGTLLDRYGPRVTAIAGCACLTLGSLLMAIASTISQFDALIAGNVFLSLGGSLIFIPSFQIANAFPKYAGTIVALVTGAFDASAAVFLFFRLAHEASGGAFSLRNFFCGYTIVPILIFLAQLTIMNADGYKTVPQLERKLEKQRNATRDVHDSDDDLSEDEVRHRREQRRDHRESNLSKLEDLLGDAAQRQVREEKQEHVEATSGVWAALHGRSACEQILSPWFILITLLTVLQMLRMNFFIATIRSQYDYMLGSKSAARAVNSFFDIALPIGGVIATPFIGMLLDNVSTAKMLAILVTLITTVGVMGSLPWLCAAYANVILFVILRPLYYSAMSDYAAKVFGFATFGRVYGAIICFSGLVNLSQPLIDGVNHEAFHDDPTPINVILSSLGLIFGTVLVAFVWMQDHKFHMKEMVRARAATERDPLISKIEEDEEDL